MSWQQLLDKREISPHRTSLKELNALRELIHRDLADAAIEALSADRRFATAYNAALQAATIVIACSGYRVSARAGHHAVTFEGATLALGSSAAALTHYFEVCRRKRNAIDYHASSVATETEAIELLGKAGEFLEVVASWVRQNHPELAGY